VSRSTAPLDVRAIERHLHADEQVSIREWCERRGIPFVAWVEHPAALGWVDLAVSRAADEAMRNGRARSRTAALRLVCGAFGFDDENWRRRWERDRKNWRQRCRSRSESAA
jgi:hypothetical protein